VLVQRIEHLQFLRQAYTGGLRNTVRCAHRIESQKDHRDTDGYLQAVQLEIRADIDEEGIKEHAHHGTGAYSLWGSFNRFIIGDKIEPVG
jgi:hypothetical protein